MELSFVTVLALLAIGIIAGSMSGLVGIGGGVIMVPLLVIMLSLSQHQAQGTSLAVLCIPVAVMAAMHYYREGHIDLRVAGIIAAGFLVGGYFGGKLAVDLHEAVLRKIFACVLLVLAVRMFFTK